MNKPPTIDICIVATLRPELLEKTMLSFGKYVKYSGEFNFIINIDLQPKPTHQNGLINKMLKFGHIFGGLNVNFSVGKGNFCLAVQNLWKNSTADFVFHLEDDWEFLREIDLDACVNTMDNWGYDYMRFPKIGAEHVGILHKVAYQPSLWRGDTVRKIAPLLDITKDPEKQCRPGQGNEALDKILISMAKNGLRDYRPPELWCKDIGREWRKKRGVDKKNGKWIYTDD